MARGFTLLELLISILVLMILLFSAIPDATRSREQIQLLRLASELHHFMLQAKSESMLRNQDLWVYFTTNEESLTLYHADDRPNNNTYNGGEWNIILMDNGPSAIFQEDENIESWSKNSHEILKISGKAYKNIYIKFKYSYNYIRFYGARGKVKNGTIEFSLSPNFTNSLKLKSSFGASRIVICATGMKYGLYPSC